MPTYDYDLIVIGSGPAGQRAAIQAAKLDKRVALIERKTVLGGVSVNTGTIPSKTFREAVLDLSGFRERAFYGVSYTVKQNITIEDLLLRTDQVIRHEIDVTRHQLTRNQRRTDRCDGFIRGTEHRPPRIRRWTRRAARDGAVDRDRHRDRSDDGSAHPVRWAAHHHQRRYSATRQAAAHAGCGRRRRRGLRVREHVRRAGRARHADRQAAAAAALRRCRDRGHARLSCCARAASRCGWTKKSAASNPFATSTATGSGSISAAASRSSPRRRCTASAAPATPAS